MRCAPWSKAWSSNCRKPCSASISWKKKKRDDTARLGQVEKSVQAVQSAPSALNPAIGMAIDATANTAPRPAAISISARRKSALPRPSIRTRARTLFSPAAEKASRSRKLRWSLRRCRGILQARAGRFFADFGRLAKFHPHEYAFVNTPLSLERIVGGESQADGVELSYLFPDAVFLARDHRRVQQTWRGKRAVDDTQVPRLEPVYLPRPAATPTSTFPTIIASSWAPAWPIRRR